MDQQFWLYFYGMFVAGAVHMVTFTSSSFDVVLGNLPDATSFVQVYFPFEMCTIISDFGLLFLKLYT